MIDVKRIMEYIEMTGESEFKYDIFCDCSSCSFITDMIKDLLKLELLSELGTYEQLSQMKDFCQQQERINKK